MQQVQDVNCALENQQQFWGKLKKNIWNNNKMGIEVKFWLYELIGGLYNADLWPIQLR